MEKILTLIGTVFYLFFASAAFAEVDSLKIPLQTARVSLDPSHVQDTSSLFVSRQINCQLVRTKGSVHILEAASSINYISPLDIMIKINQSAKFYDGTQVTAGDVVASFKHIKRTRDVLRNMFLWVKQIVIVDDKTIIFKLKKTIPQFIKVLSSPHYAIFKQKFLKQAEKNPSLWLNPLGCGGYRISHSDNKQINLTPINKGMSINFYLNHADQVSENSIDQYDIISLNIEGQTEKLREFNKIEVLDPYQIFISLNAKNSSWTDKESRCSFLAKIQENNLLQAYGDSAKLSNDLFPPGILGYAANEKYFSASKQKYLANPIPKRKSICLAYLTVSIPQKYLVAYSHMLQKIYPNIMLNPITDNRQFGSHFSQQHCDAIIFGLKSNNLDGYEYLDIFANKDANVTGIYDEKLANEIKRSQDITDTNQRVAEYRRLVSRVEDMCVIRPLISMSMRTIYVRKNLIAPGISLGSINDYYLGDVKRI